MHFCTAANDFTDTVTSAESAARLRTGLQLTSVELIKVSSGGIVIPVATVETQSSSGGGGGISGGAVAGIVIGVVGGLAILGRESSPFQRHEHHVLSYVLPCAHASELTLSYKS